MHFWNSLPLFRLVIPFILGIIFSDSLYTQLTYLFIPLLLILLIITQSFVNSYGLRWLFGIVSSCLLFVFGLCIFQYSIDKNDESYFAHFLNDDSILLLECTEEPIEKENSFKVISKVISVDNTPTKGKLLIYLEKSIDSLKYGDRVLISSRPNEITPPSNPYQFNYKKYLNVRNITHQVYVSSFDFNQVEGEWGNDFVKSINTFRNELANILSQSELNSNQLSVCTALLLVDKSEMSQELTQTFSESGVIHVLAVSGLHVGIIFLLINELLVFMNRTQLLKLLKVFIVLICLWSYAFITSLSPSVMRAATMFSFIAIANVMQRQTNIYNTLAASAFLLLIIEPSMIFEVGFQLSYLAVLGIVSIYPKIYLLLLFKSKWIDALWQLICVSIAAQIATFPLGIYYFHQFPNYFLLANVLVIPLIPLIIYFGLFYLLLFDFAFISEPVLLILKFILDNLFVILDGIQQLPQTISSFLFLQTYEVIIIYALIGFCLLSIYQKKSAYFILSLLCIVLLQFSHWNDINIQEKRSQLVFYSINKHTVFGVLEKDQGLFFANSELIDNEKSQKFNLYNHWAFLNLNDRQLMGLDTNIQRQNVWKECSHIQLGNQKLLLVDDKFELKDIDKAVEVDYCILAIDFPIDRLLKAYQPKTIIIDSSLPHYLARKIEEESNTLVLSFYNLKSEGALVVDFTN
ncbi:ComEC family competence protein [Flavobacteriales bacterium]|nr:ComEC family competence protein [Flavobacteriales bacterium]